jgi:hypothetical protein
MNLFRKKPQTPPATSSILHCSFCNKNQRYVKRLIAGPNVYICDECVEICLDIVHAPPEPYGDIGADSTEPRSMPSVAANCSICRLPFLLEEGLHVEARGVLCPACVQAVQTALAP